jgi:hypothetical protein
LLRDAPANAGGTDFHQAALFYFNDSSAAPKRRTPSLNLSSSAQNEIRR